MEQQPNPYNQQQQPPGAYPPPQQPQAAYPPPQQQPGQQPPPYPGAAPPTGPVQPAYAPPPQQSSVVVVQQPVGTTVIQGHGNCYACHQSNMISEYTVLGIVLAILFFPCGILCCLFMTRLRCPRCGATK